MASNIDPLRDWRPRHPALRDDLVHHLDPALCRALALGTPDALESVVEPLGEHLYSLRLLTERACQMLSEEVEALERWAEEEGVELDRPNSMNAYGVILDAVGYQEALTALIEHAVRPLAAHFFPEVGGATLDSHHGFIVDYAMDGDRALSLHIDDSEVTVNLCLHDDFAGGDLYFLGRRCLNHCQSGYAPEEQTRYAHQPGVALLHAGHHRHGATSLQGGQRRNLILWCRSSAYRAAHQHLACTPGCEVWRVDPA